MINVVPVVRQVLGNPAKAAKNWVARGLSGRYLRRAPRLIAESEDLKASIAHRWRVPPDRIEVVGLGVDHALFRPVDQAEARRQAGISPDRTVLMYVGALDRAHDLTPIIAALERLGDTSLGLHLVGDGELRAELSEVVEGTCRLYLEPDHRAYDLELAGTNCGSLILRGIAVIKGEKRSVRITDHRTRTCRDIPASPIVVEEERSGDVRVLRAPQE